MTAGRVTILTGAEVTGISRNGDAVAEIYTTMGEFAASRFILCTGGLSYPKSGSTGAGFSFARALGHTVTPLLPALSPITVREGWVAGLEGASFRDAAITVRSGKKVIVSTRGDGVFMRDGISGPAAMDASGAAAVSVGAGGLSLTVDLRPDTAQEALDAEVLSIFGGSMNKKAENALDALLQPKYIPVFMELAGIEPGTPVNRVSKEQRRTLAGLIKGLVFTVKGTGGFDRAMVTRGGVSLKEVDSRDMRSKIVPNLYFAGEILDIDGPTGGYNLQACWSTGRLAGTAAFPSPPCPPLP